MSSSIVIASIARTPIAKFCGSFQSLKGSELGSIAIKGALSKLGQLDLVIREAILGNVVSAGMGQAPARQAVLGAGLPESTVCTTINKVCASGMKSVMLAAQTLQCAGTATPGYAMLAGGMESMSNIPHYLPKSRTGTSLGHAQLIDGVIFDGLWDIYNNQHMGSKYSFNVTDASGNFLFSFVILSSRVSKPGLKIYPATRLRREVFPGLQYLSGRSRRIRRRVISPCPTSSYRWCF